MASMGLQYFGYGQITSATLSEYKNISRDGNEDRIAYEEAACFGTGLVVDILGD